MRFYFGLAAFVGALTACGSPCQAPGGEESDRSDNLGACVEMESETDGRRDPDVIIWRPCENADPLDSGYCRIRILGEVRLYSTNSDAVMTKPECYASEEDTCEHNL